MKFKFRKGGVSLFQVIGIGCQERLDIVCAGDGVFLVLADQLIILFFNKSRQLAFKVILPVKPVDKGAQPRALRLNDTKRLVKWSHEDIDTERPVEFIIEPGIDSAQREPDYDSAVKLIEANVCRIDDIKGAGCLK